MLFFAKVQYFQSRYVILAVPPPPPLLFSYFIDIILYMYLKGRKLPYMAMQKKSFTLWKGQGHKLF